jgi:hypothetical protein
VCTNRHLYATNEGTHQLVKTSEAEKDFNSISYLELLFTAFSRKEESSKQNVSKRPLQHLISARLNKVAQKPQCYFILNLPVLFSLSFSFLNDFVCFWGCSLNHFRCQSLSTVNVHQCSFGNDPVQSWQADTNISEERTASDNTAVFISTDLRLVDLA